MYSRDHPVALPQFWAGGGSGSDPQVAAWDIVSTCWVAAKWLVADFWKAEYVIYQSIWRPKKSCLFVSASFRIYICASSIYISRKRSNTHLARFSVAQRLFCKKNGLLSDIAQIDLFFLHSLVFTFLKCNVFVSYIYESILNFKKWGWVMRTNLNLTKAFQGRGWRLWITFLNTWSNFLYPDIWIQSCGRWC